MLVCVLEQIDLDSVLVRLYGFEGLDVSGQYGFDAELLAGWWGGFGLRLLFFLGFCFGLGGW